MSIHISKNSIRATGNDANELFKAMAKRVAEVKDQKSEAANHTPGPWSIRNKEIVGTEDVHTNGRLISPTISSRSFSEKVCEIHGDINLPSPAANARLIAAAPDLLAACVEFVRKCECGEAKSSRSYNQMKAAISKAKVSLCQKST